MQFYIFATIHSSVSIKKKKMFERFLFTTKKKIDITFIDNENVLRYTRENREVKRKLY